MVARYFNADLTKDFTLVTWDQRGSGLSYQHNPKAQNLSLEQIIQDAHQLTQLLKKKFKQEKIYLVGYSWGSMVGLHLAERYPEDYHTYVGVAQVINLREAVQVSRDWIKQQAKANQDQTYPGCWGKSDKPEFCNSDLACFFQQQQLLEKYHGAVFDTTVIKKLEKAMTQYPDYRPYDWSKGFDYSIQRLEKDLFATDLNKIQKLTLPSLFPTQTCTIGMFLWFWRKPI